MPGPVRRSAGVNETLAVAMPAPSARTRLDFEALYRSSRDDVFGYVAGMLRDRSAAEDVTAAAFERAYRKRRSFDERRGEPRAWLFGIARNAALDELRRRRRVAVLATDPEDASSAPAADDAVEGALRRSVLRAGISSLEARDRELVALKFFAGLSNAEIASVLGVSASNAGTMLHRAVQKLRKACDATP
jgi:RNA polymerase sigma-70 factor, ECF subfamily